MVLVVARTDNVLFLSYVGGVLVVIGSWNEAIPELDAGLLRVV
jgi:hypothetical protein